MKESSLPIKVLEIYTSEAWRSMCMKDRRLIHKKIIEELKKENELKSNKYFVKEYK